MSLSQEEAYQKVLDIHENIDRNSQNYGCLINWYEGVSWHYGINLKENLIFDTGGFSIFERNAKDFFIVPDVQTYNQNQTIERLCYALICFREWDYGLLGWNCEHIARLVASDSPVSYEIKKLPFPIPQLNHDGWHPNAKEILNNFINQNPNLINEIFFAYSQKSLDDKERLEWFQ